MRVIKSEGRLRGHFDPFKAAILPINLVKRPSISTTAIPNLIHRLRSVNIILTLRPRSNSQRRPPFDTILPAPYKLLPKAPLPHKPALAAQHDRSYLGARAVPQVASIDFKPDVVVGMHHLMCDCVFKLLAVLHVVRADHDAIVWVEAAVDEPVGRADLAADIGRSDLGTVGGVFDLLLEKSDYGTC